MQSFFSIKKFLLILSFLALFGVTGFAHAAPVIDSITPDTKVANSAQFTLTVDGSGFIPASVVKWDGSSRNTTFVNSTRLTAIIPAGSLTSAGTFNITVTNPEQQSVVSANMGNSGAETDPTSGVISPDGNFIYLFTFGVSNPNLVVKKYNSSDLSFVASRVISATPQGYPTNIVISPDGSYLYLGYYKTFEKLNTSNLTTAVSVSPYTPDDGTYTPFSAGISPDGNYIFVSSKLNNGLTGSIKKLNASNLTLAAEVNTNHIGTINLSPDGNYVYMWGMNNGSLLQKFSTSNLSLVNSTSQQLCNEMTFSADSNFIYCITGGTLYKINASNFSLSTSFTVSPSSALFQPLISGSYLYVLNYVQNSAEMLQISPDNLTIVSRYTIPVNTIHAYPRRIISSPAGDYQHVINIGFNEFDDILQKVQFIPVAISNSKPFSVTNAVPVITSISSTGGTDTCDPTPAFTLTVNGSGFTLNSVIAFDGLALTTNYFGPSQVRADFAAVPAEGPHSVTVVNPAPGGGTSNSVTFTTSNCPPIITTISPSTKEVNSPQFVMTVNGVFPGLSSVVRFNGSDRVTTYVSNTQLTAIIPATDMQSVGPTIITVFDQNAYNGGLSNGKIFSVVAEPFPVPTLSNINPDTKQVGDAQFTMTVTGTNFVSASVVRFNGSSRATTYVSPTQLTAVIPASDMTTVGTYNITVFNPTPGGGVSSEQVFTVNPGVPNITSITPSVAGINSPGFTMTVNGTNFRNNSVVQFAGVDRVTTFVSSTQLTAEILNGDLTALGTFNITVVTPAPGGGTSNQSPFQVVTPNPDPTITNINPTTKEAGAPGFTMTITGTDFTDDSIVCLDSLCLPGSSVNFVNGTTLTVQFSSTPPAGVYDITVVNPAPGGGTSNAVPFTVNEPPLESVYADNLDISMSICPLSVDTGLAYFYWNYRNTGGYPEFQFTFQVAKDAEFTDIIVDRTFSNLSNPPDTLNQQTVEMRMLGGGVAGGVFPQPKSILSYFIPEVMAIQGPPSPENTLEYGGGTYYWRVMVWEDHPTQGVRPSVWTYGDPFQTPLHPGPWVDFTWSPIAPLIGQQVSFTGETLCYNAQGDVVPCTSYEGSFGDGPPMAPLANPNPTHTFTAAGTYNVTLGVRDADDNYCEAIKSVTVSPLNAGTNNGLPFWREVSPFR